MAAFGAGCGGVSDLSQAAVSPACFFVHCFGWLMFLNRRLETHGKTSTDGRFRKCGTWMSRPYMVLIPTRTVPIRNIFCLETSHPKHRTKKQAGLTAVGDKPETSPQPAPNTAMPCSAALRRVIPPFTTLL